MEMRNPDVCVVGVGYVGLTLAVALVDCGYRVIGVERNPDTLACLQAGKPHFKEKGLDKKYARYFADGKIVVRADLTPEARAATYIVTVGTPLDINKRVRTDYMENAARMIAKALQPGDLVILRSTVKIGTLRNVVKPIFDATGITYYLAVCPERTLEGNAIEELRHLPQIVGGIDTASTEKAATFFATVTPDIVRTSSPEVAEMAKLVCNTQRDLFFAYANEVALMADAAGIDAGEVIHTANFRYPRSRVAHPGPVGGPCLEKDAYILAESMRERGFTPELVMHGRVVNEKIVEHGVASLISVLQKKSMAPGDIGKIAVLGLAFKGEPETGDIRGSLAISLIRSLEESFPRATVIGYDPVSTPEEAAHWGITKVAQGLKDACRDCNILVIQNNHPAFKGEALRPFLSSLAPEAMLYDFWNSVSPSLMQEMGITRIGLGLPLAALNTQELLNAPLKQSAR